MKGNRKNYKLVISILFFILYMYICTVGRGYAAVVREDGDGNDGLSRIQHVYDSVGKLEKAVFPDGTEIIYAYDANGNIISATINHRDGKAEDSDKADGGSTDEGGLDDSKGSDAITENTTESSLKDKPENITESTSKESVEKTTENSLNDNPEKVKKNNTREQAENTAESDLKSKSEKVAESSQSVPLDKETQNGDIVNNQISDNDIAVFDDMSHILKQPDQDVMLEIDEADYRRFKQKHPVIKSLKRSKNGTMLTIRIRTVTKKDKICETGYEIRYSTDKKFKKSKKINVKRTKKGFITKKKWKAAKKKTYYVKVRAYIKRKNGKRVYGKYSKVKEVR